MGTYGGVGGNCSPRAGLEEKDTQDTGGRTWEPGVKRDVRNL